MTLCKVSSIHLQVMKVFTFAITSEKCPILAYEFKPSRKQKAPKVLILGGVHGDEPEGVIAAQGLLNKLISSFPYHLHLTLIPIFNPHGVFHFKRTNASQVDLNRNLPTRDWSPRARKKKYAPGPKPCSELENKALVRWLKKEKPQLVISLHSWKPLININGPCQKQAQAIAQHTQYKIVNDIGYPTPGSLGSYCEKELQIPCLTYEIERGLKFSQIIPTHVTALEKALKVT